MSPADGSGSTEATQAAANPEMAEAAERARKVARQRLGEALAEKATDEFCLAYAGAGAGIGAMRLTSAGTETIAAPAPEQQQAVIELRDPSDDRPAVLETVATALGGHGVAEAVSAALQALGKDVGPAERALSLLARQATIRAERDRFYHDLGGLRDDVERATGALAIGTNERPRIGIAAAPVQACWLNNTIRADTHASVLGDIAGEKAVERIDVPRKIEREAVDVTIESAEVLRADKKLSGAGVLVGVIDSEVQLDHPALSGRVVHRRNYTQEPFGTPDSHGTAVAGLIAASSEGFTGMAPAAQIYNYKVLATQSALDSTEFEAFLAIQHALEDGVRVVNCSWGNGPAGDGSGREARGCDKAWRLGMTIVKSAGNKGPGAQTLTTPADADGVLVVGATTVDGISVPDYSSRGPTPGGKKRPHVVAPGGDFDAEIDGTMLGGATGTLQDVGTSFAAPHVTGLAALLIESEPKLTPDQQRDRIIATCKALANASEDEQGAGLVTPAAL
jgi:serine protease AprX